MKSASTLTAGLVLLALGATSASAHMKAHTPGSAEGSGVVKAVNMKAGTVTLDHGPIPAIKWPAMTMAFKAEPSSLLTRAKVGQKVHFTLERKNGTPILTDLDAVK